MRQHTYVSTLCRLLLMYILFINLSSSGFLPWDTNNKSNGYRSILPRPVYSCKLILFFTFTKWAQNHEKYILYFFMILCSIRNLRAMFINKINYLIKKNWIILLQIYGYQEDRLISLFGTTCFKFRGKVTIY